LVAALRNKMSSSSLDVFGFAGGELMIDDANLHLSAYRFTA
jgi:hypothetical protein